MLSRDCVASYCRQRWRTPCSPAADQPSGSCLDGGRVSRDPPARGDGGASAASPSLPPRNVTPDRAIAIAPTADRAVEGDAGGNAAATPGRRREDNRGVVRLAATGAFLAWPTWCCSGAGMPDDRWVTGGDCAISTEDEMLPCCSSRRRLLSNRRAVACGQPAHPSSPTTPSLSKLCPSQP